jgi:hypothetical protein
MRKVIAVAFLPVVVYASLVFAGEEYKNYQLTVDEKTYELNLGEEIQIIDKSGNKVTIGLRAKPYTEYSDQFISFHYKRGLSFSAQDLGGGIQQLMAATAQLGP